MVSAEKVFRMYTDPSATESDIISVDRKIDEFLSKRFVQYKSYFKDRVSLNVKPGSAKGDAKPEPVKVDTNPDYVYFRKMKEDDQYDDLTILAIRKK
jgi:hypothetical protein